MVELETLVGTPIAMYGGSDFNTVKGSNLHSEYKYATQLIAIILETEDGQKIVRMYGRNSPMACLGALLTQTIDEGKEAERMKKNRPQIKIKGYINSEYEFQESYFTNELEIKGYTISWAEDYKMTVIREKTNICLPRE